MGSAHAQPAPQPLSILDVPFISQSEALCGGAAAAMVLRYWGARGLDAESFAHLVDRTAAGIRTTRLIEDLRQRGWNAIAVEGRGEAIDRELIAGRPVLTLVEDRPGTFHYIVIVAATAQAIVFHDPARAPFRVMDRERFEQRWSRANRWMAVITPGEAASRPSPLSSDAGPVSDSSTCSGRVASGVRNAQAGALDAAERDLTAALSCGGSAPFRELAGVRLLQKRWPEVSELASAAIAADPMDAYAWQLLATSRFVQNDPAGALEAWNRIAQPHVDLVSVGGLVRTRQPVVERLLAIKPQSLLTPALLDRSARRLTGLPSAEGARVEYVPKPSGLAELRAHVVERPLVPGDAWSYVSLGLVAASRREVAISAGSLTGGGERIAAGWRFWPGRPRVNVNVTAPAPWGGLWGADAFAERQPFSDDTFPTARRASAGITASNWITSHARASARAGVDRWDDRGTYFTTTGELLLATARDRLVVALDGSGWAGEDPFGAFAASLRLRSSDALRGRQFIARAGGAAVTTSTPADLWYAGDVGTVRPALLRAHPVIDDGSLLSDRLGRSIAHVSGEVRQWWTIKPAIHLGAALFADAAHVAQRAGNDSRGDVDLGGGLRLGFPGLDGVFRIDLGKGVRDGATAVSFVYEP